MYGSKKLFYPIRSEFSVCCLWDIILNSCLARRAYNGLLVLKILLKMFHVPGFKTLNEKLLSIVFLHDQFCCAIATIRGSSTECVIRSNISCWLRAPMELLRNKITVYEASSRRNHFWLMLREVYFEVTYWTNDPEFFIVAIKFHLIELLRVMLKILRSLHR